MYSGAMEAIKTDPSRKPSPKYTIDKSFKKPGKSTVAERMARVASKKAIQVRFLTLAPSPPVSFCSTPTTPLTHTYPTLNTFHLNSQKDKLLKAMAEVEEEEDEEDE